MQRPCCTCFIRSKTRSGPAAPSQGHLPLEDVRGRPVQHVHEVCDKADEADLHSFVLTVSALLARRQDGGLQRPRPVRGAFRYKTYAADLYDKNVPRNPWTRAMLLQTFIDLNNSVQDWFRSRSAETSASTPTPLATATAPTAWKWTART